MRTDDLIAALALDTPATSTRAIERGLLLWMVPAGGLVLAGVILWLGLRDDLAVAFTGPTFWAKAVYSLGLGLGGFWLLDRLGRPGSSARSPLVLLGVILGVAVLSGVVELTTLTASDRTAAIMGSSARACPVNIVILSALAAPFVFWAARQFAPVRPGLAGAAAGLLTAGLATTLYGLHCGEHTAAFVATWYTLGMALATGAGAVIGRFVLRW